MSTITRERLEPVIERLEHYATNVKWTSVQAAQDMLISADAMRRLLASLEAEPVAWEWFYYKQWNVTNDQERAKDVADGGVEVFPLYRRATMLQGAEPVATAYKLPSMGSNEVNEASWVLHNQLTKFGPLNGYQFNNLKGCFYEALKVAMGNSPVIQGCSCLTCSPVTFSDSRFVVCPECGNKRCPHANDHRNACTGSNEPGQEGSAYPAAPQLEVK